MDPKILLKKRSTIVIILLIFALLAFIVSMFQPLRYGAKAKLLVVQNVPAGSDPYALSRSNAYLSVVLSQVIETNSFYRDVIEGGFGIQQRYFEQKESAEQISKRWKKTVLAKSAGDTGVIEIEVFHPDKAQAEAVAQGVIAILSQKHQQFHGGGESVEIKTIDSPIISQVSPNIPLNFALALVVGIVVSIAYISQYPSEVHNLSISKKKKDQSDNEEILSEERKAAIAIGN